MHGDLPQPAATFFGSNAAHETELLYAGLQGARFGGSRDRGSTDRCPADRRIV
jgi:hypothetical protein